MTQGINTIKKKIEIFDWPSSQKNVEIDIQHTHIFGQ